MADKNPTAGVNGNVPPRGNFSRQRRELEKYLTANTNSTALTNGHAVDSMTNIDALRSDYEWNSDVTEYYR